MIGFYPRQVCNKFISSQTVAAVVDDASLASRNAEANLFRMVEAYRKMGHSRANLDPLGLRAKE